ncbi:MAG: hypothetical protein IPJ40_07605 [Saprospirales bacterium]|nr:hypothetical protein [Saprospirales bacterium]
MPRQTVLSYKGKTTPLVLVNQYKYDQRTGKQSEVTTPTGAVSRKTFDDFGRILAVAESVPDDVSSVLTKETYSYELVGVSGGFTNNRIIHTMHQDGYDVIGQEITFLDGFYRTVQTKNLTTLLETPDATLTGFRTLCYQYNQEGKVARSFQPYFTQGDFFTPIDLSLPHILTHFDPLGRLIRIQPVNMSEPDSPMAGETREYTLAGQQHARIIHQGAHETKYLYNSGGQITDIFQKNGRDLPHPIFYDVLDRLIRIQDQYGATTTFTYDSMDEKGK